MGRTLKLFICFLFGLGLIGFILLVYANWFMIFHFGKLFSQEQVPTSTIALVFGGGMKTKTEMSDMQYDRVNVGAQLYHGGKIQKIMITGDDGALRGDEISAMKKQLLDWGVPQEAILIDPHGYRTYESCWREARLYGVTSTIVVSQSFHLPRIQYLCEHFGIQTIPVSADLRDYDSWWVGYTREYLARLKAWWQVEITEPMPRVLEF